MRTQMKALRRCLLAATVTTTAHAQTPSQLHLSWLPLAPGVSVRVGEQRPAGPIKADILYLHGFADRLDNHDPLFQAWNTAGYRVLSFDFPSHGETEGLGIDFFAGASPMSGLARLVVEVERVTREDDERPLILAGWSTGGLVAVRLEQGLERLERQPAAVILLAPGVAVRPLVGSFGRVTEETLTRNPNPPHKGPIKPLSPLLHPVFAANLLVHVYKSWQDAYPSDIPTLVMLGGEEDDRYVVSHKIDEWVTAKREDDQSMIWIAECDKARHELDNEPDPVGIDVRSITTGFADFALSIGQFPANKVCQLH